MSLKILDKKGSCWKRVIQAQHEMMMTILFRVEILISHFWPHEKCTDIGNGKHCWTWNGKEAEKNQCSQVSCALLFTNVVGIDEFLLIEHSVLCTGAIHMDKLANMNKLSRHQSGVLLFTDAWNIHSQMRQLSREQKIKLCKQKLSLFRSAKKFNFSICRMKNVGKVPKKVKI